MSCLTIVAIKNALDEFSDKVRKMLRIDNKNARSVEFRLTGR